MYETKNFKFVDVKLSYDRKTNLWKVQCKKCNNWFSPPTTMFAEQIVKCSNTKCDNSELVNYNKL